MATGKQLAALKKARAARAKNLAKKKPARKSSATKTVVKKKPTRRTAVTKRKAPRKTGYLLAATKAGKPIGYWDGSEFWSQKAKGKRYTNLATVKRAADAAKKKISSDYGLAAIDLKG